MVDAAAKASGLDIVEIKSYLPAGLTIWIDPREVSCRLTENGPVQVIYRGGGGGGGGSALMLSDAIHGGARRSAESDEADGELQRASCGFDSFTAGARVQNLSPSPGWSSSGGRSAGSAGGSPVTGGTARALHPPLGTTTCFTAATFAQTKFGSTKMKSQGPQRPSRLSPIEPLPGGFPARLSPSSAPLPACWALGSTGGLSPTGSRLSPMQHGSSAQLGMLPSGGGDARLQASLQDWILLQHRHQQQQMLYLTALKQQQQQQHGAMTSPAAPPSLANAHLASPHQYDASLRQHRQPSQLQQHVPPMPAHGVIASHDSGLFPPLIRDAGVTSALKDDSVHLSPAECVDWGLDVAVPGFATGLQQLLLAN